MRVLVADHNPKNIQVIVDYDCTFDHEVGNPIAFEIDAVGSLLLYLLMLSNAVLEQYSNYYFMHAEVTLRDKVIF